MLDKYNLKFVFSYRKTLPSVAAARIWQRWSSQSTWQQWDKSISCTLDASELIATGQQFFVVPHQARKPIYVTVVSAAEGLHFTTVATVELGLLAFGHTIIHREGGQEIILEHSICAVPVAVELFRTQHWDRFKRNIAESVEILSQYVMME